MAGDQVSVAVDNQYGAMLPALTLCDSSGTVIAQGDWQGPNACPYVSGAAIPAGGTYYVHVGHYFDSDSSGGYQLRVDLCAA